MGLAVFILGLFSILLGLALIVKERLVSKASVHATTLGAEPSLDAMTKLINALANFAEKLFGQFAPKERLSVFLIVIGLVACGLGWWFAG